ncbi:hypothetical protein Fmac_022317 [Flemingia macrophylla]|uniref:Uncharacterized protein n=1 Tax=Flemingia macrophylla TaxID=520843 RepID=A0ABD1LZD0_9FABA
MFSTFSLSVSCNPKTPNLLKPFHCSGFPNNPGFRLHCYQERSLPPPAVGPDESTERILISKDHVLSDHDLVLQQNGLPPLVSALKASSERNAASFHFPGHNRGRAAPASLTRLIGRRPYVHDLPAIPELDNLFCPQGPILEAQTEAYLWDTGSNNGNLFSRRISDSSKEFSYIRYICYGVIWCSAQVHHS